MQNPIYNHTYQTYSPTLVSKSKSKRMLSECFVWNLNEPQPFIILRIIKNAQKIKIGEKSQFKPINRKNKIEGILLNPQVIEKEERSKRV